MGDSNQSENARRRAKEALRKQADEMAALQAQVWVWVGVDVGLRVGVGRVIGMRVWVWLGMWVGVNVGVGMLSLGWLNIVSHVI